MLNRAMLSDNLTQPASHFVPLENFPGHLTRVPCILGIDEAGRGPVLGPLVYSIFVCPAEDEGRLKQLGVAGTLLFVVSRVTCDRLQGAGCEAARGFC